MGDRLQIALFCREPDHHEAPSEKDVPIPVQEMRDIKQRLSYMDELGIDKQVVFPSIWLGCLAENVELEAALARSPRATRRPMARRKSFCLLRHRSGYLRAGHRVALHDTDQNASQRLTRVIHTILHR
jgi:hypothetical protein